MRKRKGPEHQAETDARKKRRAKRSARTAEFPPRDVKPAKTTTDVVVVQNAHEKQERRRLRRMNQIASHHFD